MAHMSGCTHVYAHVWYQVEKACALRLIGALFDAVRYTEIKETVSLKYTQVVPADGKDAQSLLTRTVLKVRGRGAESLVCPGALGVDLPLH